MKKNILFLILSAFAVTVKAAELCSMVSDNVGLYSQNRSENRPLQERLKKPGMQIRFENVKLALLDFKAKEAFINDNKKSIELLELKEDRSKIALRATLIDDTEMNPAISGLLLGLFSPTELFMNHLAGQSQNETVYFKVSGLYGGSAKFMAFYFAVPSQKIISDFGFKQQPQKPELFEKTEQSSFSWIKYAAIPFGLLAILSVWYFKYKR